MTHTTTPEDTMTDAARRFVELTHMADWIWNEERAALAARLGLGDYRTHDAYLRARSLAGML